MGYFCKKFLRPYTEKDNHVDASPEKIAQAPRNLNEVVVSFFFLLIEYRAGGGEG